MRKTLVTRTVTVFAIVSHKAYCDDLCSPYIDRGLDRIRNHQESYANHFERVVRVDGPGDPWRSYPGKSVVTWGVRSQWRWWIIPIPRELAYILVEKGW